MKSYLLTDMNKQDIKSFEEYAELISVDIAETYGKNPDEILKFFLKDKQVTPENMPIVGFKRFMKNDKVHFMDQFENIYDENFKYLEKSANERKRKHKKNKDEVITFADL